LRRFNLELGDKVTASIGAGHFPIVLGGDCSNLLGSLLGLRHAGGRGLVHIDGHSDFYHPRNYDTSSRLGSAAGMDLALVTGRGEDLLTKWPDVDGPLVADPDVVQLGERERAEPDYPFKEIASTEITQVTVQELLARGLKDVVPCTTELLRHRKMDSAWLHIDVDVLDQAVMPAVDSPGSPGLNFNQLEELIRGILVSGRIAGADVSIYDPDLDPTLKHARGLLTALAAFKAISGD